MTFIELYEEHMYSIILLT